jgi:hypothetical protein
MHELVDLCRGSFIHVTFVTDWRLSQFGWRGSFYEASDTERATIHWAPSIAADDFHYADIFQLATSFSKYLNSPGQTEPVGARSNPGIV